MTVDQSQFRDALLASDASTPDGLSDGKGHPAGNRFSIYKNNVALARIDAVHKSFPILHKIIGSTAFDALARSYAQSCPPQNPIMFQYGQDMPAFLTKYAALSHLGYLPDVAQLEHQLRMSYHAADAKPMPTTLLSNLRETNSFSFAPAVTLVHSKWPLWDIWRFNCAHDVPKPREVAQDVLITRQLFDPEPHLLTKGDSAFMQTLLAGEPLGAALDNAFSLDPQFDMTGILTLLNQENALIGFL